MASRLKMNLSGRAAVRFGTPWGHRSLRRPAGRNAVRSAGFVKGFWLMAKEIGVVAECTDVQLDTAEAECPF